MRLMSVRCRVLTLVATLGLICPLFGQSAGGTPPPGDPNVVAMFLTYYDSLAADIRAARQQNTATADIAEQSAAKSIGGLTVSDFRAIGNVYSALKQQLQSLDAEGAAYVQGLIAAQQAPDLAKLHEFDSHGETGVTLIRRQPGL